MKKKVLLIFLLSSFSLTFYAQYFDDIYYNPKNDKKSEAISVTQEKQEKTENVTATKKAVRDVDEYNRQTSSTTNASKMNNSTLEQDADNLEYSKRISKFHDSTNITINDAQSVYIYNYAEPEDENQSTVYLNYSSNWGSWGYYGYRTYSPYYWDNYYGVGYYSYYNPYYYYGYSYRPYYYGYYNYYPYHPYHPYPTHHPWGYNQPHHGQYHKEYNNYNRTPNYGNGRSYSSHETGVRSTRSESGNGNVTNTRSSSTNNNSGRSYNSNSTQGTRSTQSRNTSIQNTTVTPSSNSRSYKSSGNTERNSGGSSSGGTRSGRSFGK